MTTAQPVKKRRFRLKHYLLAALAAFVALIAWVAYLGSAAETQFARFAVACDGQAVTTAATAGSGRRGVAFERDRERKWRVRLFGIPDDMTADDAAAVAFVACLEPANKIALDRCGFREGVGVRVLGIPVAGVSTGGVTVYPRVQYEQPVRVIATQSGRLIAEGNVRGGMPPACDRYTGKPSESTFEGSTVDAKLLGAWLAERLPRP